MRQQDIINLLISIQEHPDRYTDEQLQRIMTDQPELAELLDQLAITKQAFVKQEADEEAILIEGEWQEFAAAHTDEINALEKDKSQVTTIKRRMGKLPYKVAASIVGILFTAGVAFAAIHIARLVAGGDLKSSTQEVRISNPHQQVIPRNTSTTLPTDTIKTDTTIKSQPIVFDNVPLEKMLPQIATHYHKEVTFLHDDTRRLRFYFVWKHDETLDDVLHRLNLFESINVELKSDKIVVE